MTLNGRTMSVISRYFTELGKCKCKQSFVLRLLQYKMTDGA